MLSSFLNCDLKLISSDASFDSLCNDIERQNKKRAIMQKDNMLADILVAGMKIR